MTRRAELAVFLNVIANDCNKEVGVGGLVRSQLFCLKTLMTFNVMGNYTADETVLEIVQVLVLESQDSDTTGCRELTSADKMYSVPEKNSK